MMLRLPRNSIMFYCSAGLGNRMLALGAAIELGQAIDKQVYLYWPVNKHLRCRFGDLFENPPRFKVLSQSAVVHCPKFVLSRTSRGQPPAPADRLEWHPMPPHPHNSWVAQPSPGKHGTNIEQDIRASWRPLPAWRWRKPLQAWRPLARMLAWRHYWSFDAVLWEVRRSYFTLSEADKLRARQRIYINSSYHFFPGPSTVAQAWDHLVPIRSIRDKVDELASSFTDRTIGVHIRRRDFVDMGWASRSPTELFVRLMEDEIARDADVRFYVATDSEQELADLQGRFGSRIVTQPTAHRASRSSTEAIRDAVVDMYTLARTNKIIASAVSTFSQMAARIGQTEYQAVDAREQIHQPEHTSRLEQVR